MNDKFAIIRKIHNFVKRKLTMRTRRFNTKLKINSTFFYFHQILCQQGPGQLMKIRNYLRVFFIHSFFDVNTKWKK